MPTKKTNTPEEKKPEENNAKTEDLKKNTVSAEGQFLTTNQGLRINDDQNIEWKIKDYMDVVDMFMFDTGGETYGGSGKKFDWEKLKNLNINKPFFLSGGISGDDVEALKNFSTYPVAKDFFAVDINSKFEILPGIKDMSLVKKFVEELNG